MLIPNDENTKTETGTRLEPIAKALREALAGRRVPLDEIDYFDAAWAALQSVHNLPPLFEVDDWLWVAQSLGSVRFSGEDDGFEARHRMDRIIARILEYHAEDVRKERGE